MARSKMPLQTAANVGVHTGAERVAGCRSSWPPTSFSGGASVANSGSVERFLAIA
jgi:hypothetical protein